MEKTELSDFAGYGWSTMARAVAEHCPDAIDGGHGIRMRAQKEAAEALGLSWNTLRSYLEAYRFFLDLSGEPLAEKFRLQSIDVARSIARWAKWDRNAALEFLLITPCPSTAGTLAAEREAKARATSSDSVPGRLTIAANAIRSEGRARPLLRDHLALLGYCGLERLELVEAREAGTQNGAELGSESVIVYRAIGAQPDVLDALVLRAVNHSIADAYRREARSILFRALAAAIHCPLVVLPFPDLRARQAFLEGRPILPFEAGAPAMIPSLKALPAPRTFDRNQPIVRPSAAAGAIIATTAESFATDLFEA
ncbi:MAG TPA: hypothetical protein DIT93_11950 [Pelagibacterium sp.]|nr:hypothetical protein [Pelagibacterium sp.]|tara:strand:- start:1614 stop:2546 length:933 start_codon:yes stop_codon:yes gene_type:complete